MSHSSAAFGLLVVAVITMRVKICVFQRHLLLMCHCNINPPTKFTFTGCKASVEHYAGDLSVLRNMEQSLHSI